MKKLLSILLLTCMLTPVLSGITLFETNAVSEAVLKVVSLSAGVDMSGTVLSDGSVWVWGGSGTKDRGVFGAYIHAPQKVISSGASSIICSLTSASAVSSYNCGPNTAVLQDTGALWIWGANGSGQLGNGSTYFTSNHCKVLDEVVSYAVSGYSSAAVTQDESVYLWGSIGNLVENASTYSTTPMKVMDGAAKVFLAYSTVAVIKNDGSLWMWGNNDYGQLGNGTISNAVKSPTKVVGIDNVQDVSIGNGFVAVLKNDGSLWMWGKNSSGQLGKGNTQTTISDYSPSMVSELGNNVVAISSGYAHVAAVLKDGTLKMWGSNSSGQLGNSSHITLSEPTRIMRNIEKVACGSSHTLALKNDGSLLAWGDNEYGKLGDGTNTDSDHPIEVKIGTLKADIKVADKTKEMNFEWDPGDLLCDSSKYNQKLALAGIALSEAAYSDPRIVNEFGFTIETDLHNNDSIDRPGLIIGYNVLYDFGNPTVEILVTIRGTKSIFSWDAITDIKSVANAFQDATHYCYSSLKRAKLQIENSVALRGFSMTKANTKYYIVGHSLGAACAAKMALWMANDDFARPSNIFAYTFATPNYTNVQLNMDTEVDVPGLFNFVNVEDVVPYIPQRMYHSIFNVVPLYKAGHTYYYKYNSNTAGFDSTIKELYDEIPWDLHMELKAHMLPVYYALIKNCPQAFSVINFVEGVSGVLGNDNLKYYYQKNQHLINCRAEIEVYNPQGVLCAYTKEGQVCYPVASGVRIEIVDEDKLVELPPNGEYRIEYKGTDSGLMNIEDQMVNPTNGEVEFETKYDNVAIEKDKAFSSVVSSSVEEHTKLYVIDDEGDNIKYVDNQGNETILGTRDISKENIHLLISDEKYTGEEIAFNVSVDGLKEGLDYRVIYSDNINCGIASVAVKGINDYYGRVTKHFRIYDEGECGKGVTWEIKEKGIMTVSGDGSIDDYNATDEKFAPWYSHCTEIESVVINSGVSSIGNEAFAGCENLRIITIPESVKCIGESVFKGCGNVIVRARDESFAHQYAIDNGMLFESVPDYMRGDLDGDGAITVTDALMALRFAAKLATPTENDIRIADIDNDGHITVTDSLSILRVAAKLTDAL